MICYEDFCAKAVLEPSKELYNSALESGELTTKKYVSRDFLLSINEKYKLFSTCIADVLKAAEFISSDEFSLIYMNLLRITLFNQREKFIIPVVFDKNNITHCYAPLFSLLSFVDDFDQKMQQRGIPLENRLAVHGKYENFLILQKQKYGYYAIVPTKYNWLRYYFTSNIFPIGNLEFELMPFPSADYVFEAKDGNVCPLREITEYDQYYEGKRILRGGSSFENAKLSKAEYNLVVKPGDYVLNIHIPHGAKVGVDFYKQDFEKAETFFNKYYPEMEIKVFACCSWLMDPELFTILKPESNILSFQSLFNCYPTESEGKEVFSFVFKEEPTDYSLLPEDTSLMRALKKRYQNNEPIYAYRGICKKCIK